MSKRFAIFLGVLGLVGFVFVLRMIAREPAIYAQSPNAINKSLEYARAAGLVGDPTEMTIARMDYATFRGLIDPEGAPPELQATGLEDDSSTKPQATGRFSDAAWANRDIWVLGVRGKVVLQLPGAIGDQYDNLIVAIDAETGKLVDIAARAPGYEVKLQGERVTIEDGKRFPLAGSETFPSPIPPMPTITPILTP